MVRCEECVFWGVPKDNRFNWSRKSKTHRCCGSGKFIYDPDSFALDHKVSIPIDAVGYTDGELCQADLWTGAKFGCIHGKKLGIASCTES